jgi:hypothetical protein
VQNKFLISASIPVYYFHFNPPVYAKAINLCNNDLYTVQLRDPQSPER